MPKYEVQVCRTSYAHRSIEVDAANREEAEQSALDMAGNFSYSEKDAEYSVTHVREGGTNNATN
jgi:hypothetical protein